MPEIDRNLENEFVETKLELAKALAKIDELHNSSSRRSSFCEDSVLKKERDKLAEENYRMKEVLATSALRTDKIDEENARLREEVASLKKQLETTHQQGYGPEYKKTKVQSLSKRNELLQEQVEQLTRERNQYFDALEKDDRLDPEEVEEAISDIRAQLKQKLQENMQENAKLSLENKNLVARLKDLSVKDGQLRALVKKVMDEQTALKSRLENEGKVDHDAVEAANAVEEANKQIRISLKRKLQEKNAQFLELNLNFEKVSDELTELKRVMEELRNKLQNVEQEKTKAEEALHDLRCSMHDHGSNELFNLELMANASRPVRRGSMRSTGSSGSRRSTSSARTSIDRRANFQSSKKDRNASTVW